MTTSDRHAELKKIRETASAQMTEEMFMLFDLLLCGHTPEKNQEAFIADAKNRGILK